MDIKYNYVICIHNYSDNKNKEVADTVVKYLKTEGYVKKDGILIYEFTDSYFVFVETSEDINLRKLFTVISIKYKFEWNSEFSSLGYNRSDKTFTAYNPNSATKVDTQYINSYSFELLLNYFSNDSSASDLSEYFRKEYIDNKMLGVTYNAIEDLSNLLGLLNLSNIGNYLLCKCIIALLK